MQRFNTALKFSILSFCLVVLLPDAAFAEKPAWKEGGKHQKPHQNPKQHSGKDRDYRRSDEPRKHHDGNSMDRWSGSSYFTDRHRSAIREYYVDQFRSGHCPPGLAKKQNGCLPPGQAKKWNVGHPLPPDVIYYDLPPAVALSLGPAPAGYRYVRVASDILMIAVGTGMVMDAIMDLGGLY
ncbi:MAG: hypothetical protein ACU83N_01675 [Gammaproteobacteria bacterium]